MFNAELVYTYLLTIEFYEKLKHTITVDSNLADLQGLLEHLSSAAGIKELTVFQLGLAFPYTQPPEKMTRKDLRIDTRPSYIPKMK